MLHPPSRALARHFRPHDLAAPLRVSIPKRTFLGLRRRAPPRAVEDLDVNALRRRRADYDRDRTWFLAAGAISGVIALVVLSRRLYIELQKEKAKSDKNNDAGSPKITRFDSPTPTETYTIDGDVRRKVIVHDAEGREIVPTGNSTVPSFPRTLNIGPSNAEQSSSSTPLAAAIEDKSGVEYTLVGLGLRTVSIFSIQVYVVGLYVATADIAALQSRLVKQATPAGGPSATTLVPDERDQLRVVLSDPSPAGERAWEETLLAPGCRSAFRVVPVRDTDFHHLRDGFMRAVAARSSSYTDDGFGAAVRDFKALFNRGSVPKRKELLLCRDEKGRLAVLYDPGSDKSSRRKAIGGVDDERVSRLLWLNYLAGRKVASEPARQSIIDGIMEFVERPIGTVAAQVVATRVA